EAQVRIIGRIAQLAGTAGLLFDGYTEHQSRSEIRCFSTRLRSVGPHSGRTVEGVGAFGALPFVIGLQIVYSPDAVRSLSALIVRAGSGHAAGKVQRSRKQF